MKQSIAATLTDETFTATDLRAWAKGAGQKHIFAYHLGHLAKDRINNKRLNALADFASLLDEAGFCSLVQRRVQDYFCYLVERTTKTWREIDVEAIARQRAVQRQRDEQNLVWKARQSERKKQAKAAGL